MSDISFTTTNEGIPEDARYWMEKDKANAKAMSYTPDQRVLQSQRAYQSAYGADIDPNDILPNGKGISGVSNMDEIEQFENELPTFLQMVNESNRNTYVDATMSLDSKLGNFVRGAYQNAETKEQLEGWEFASILSEMTGLSVRFCKDNEKDLIKTYTGRDIDRSNFLTGLGKSFWSRVASDYASVKARILNSQLSDMNERQRQIAIDDFMDNELPQLSYYWNPDMYGYKDSVLGKVAYFTFENLPSVVESQLTGLLAGGIVSVAKAAKGVVDFAYNLTRVASVFERESGSALLGMWSTLNDNGQRMDWQTMNTASTQIGMVNTAFEFVLEKMLGAVGVRTSERWGRNVKDMFSKYGKMSSKNVMDAAIETTGKYVAKGVWNNAKNALGEATTEAMQTWSEDFFTNLAYRKSEGFGDYVMSHRDILKDMAQTFAYTAASTFLEAPLMLGQDSDAFSVYGYVRDRKDGRIVSISQANRYSTKTDSSTLTRFDSVSIPKGTKASDMQTDTNAKVYKVGDSYIPASKEDASKLAGIKEKTNAVYVDVVNQKVEGTPIDFNMDSTMQGYASRSNAKVSGDTIVVKDTNALDRTVASIMQSDGFVSAQLLKDGDPTTNGDFDEAKLSIRDSNGELRTMAVVDESTAKARGIQAVSVESTDSAINQSIKDRRNASQDAQTAQRIASARKLTQKEMDNTFNSYVSDLDRKDKAYVNRLRRNTEAMVTELYGDRKDAKAIASVSTSLLVDFAKLNGMGVQKYVDTRLGGADSRFINIMTKADAETSGTSAFIQRNDNGTWTVNLYNAPNSQTQLIHEFSHMFLSTLGNESVVDRFKSIYRDEYESGGIMGKEFQERFATDLEAYVVSGKAKSKGLRAVFETIVRAINNFGKLIRGIDFDNKADAMAAFDELFSDERLNQTKRNASTVERLSSIVESIDRAYEAVSKLDSADSEDMVFSMDYLKEIATQLEDSDAQDRAGLWSEFRDTATDLRDYLDATASEDSVVQSLADSLSEESISEILKGRPLATSDTDIMNAMYRMRYGNPIDSSALYRKENSGIIREGERYGIQREFSDIREGQLHEGGALRASGIGSDEGRSDTLRYNGVPEAERFAQREDLGRSGRLGDGRARLRRIIKGLDKDADYVPTPELEKTYDNAKRFHDAIEKARLTQKYGLYVSLYPTDTIDHGDWKETGYSDPSMRLFLSDDNSVGFALHGEDIVSVFSDKTVADHPKSIYSILLNALEAGGRKLDCYGKGLVRLYERMGFVLDGKIAYNPEYETEEWSAKKETLGSPDVFALHWGDSSLDETIAKLPERIESITYKSVDEQINAMDYFSEGDSAYDDLMGHRDEMLAMSRADGTEDDYLLAAEEGETYGKNVDFKRSDVSILVPYTTEQTIQRITIGKPVESADIVTLLETDTQMSKYQRNVLKKELEAIRILTSDPILNETILKAYEEKRNAYDAYDLVVQRMKELDPSFAFRSKRDGLDLIRRAVAHSEWHTTDTLNADFVSTFSKDRNANIDRLLRTLIGNGYLYNELRDMPMTALRRIADLTSDGLKVSEATYDNAYAEITDPYNTTTLRRASEGGVVYEDADRVYSPSSVKVDAKRFAESLHDSTLPDEYREALKEGSYNDDMLDRLDEYVKGQYELASKTEESRKAYEDLKASYEKDMDTMVSELEDSYAEIERLNSIKAKLEQDYRNKVLEANDYAAKKTELERQLSLAKAKYARYVGRQRSNALNAEIRRESVSNRETQDHTLGRDRTLLYADLIHTKKEIAKALADGKPLQMKSDIQKNFPALYDWLQSKGMFSGKEIMGNLKQLSFKDRQELLGLIKDYKAMSIDTLKAREDSKKSKASSDAVLMKRNMKIDNRWHLDEAETAEVSRKVDENIAKMMKNGELASDADIQAIRETMMLDAVGKAERSKSRTEARPGNTEYRRSTKEGMLTKMKAAYDIPRHILRGMGRNIELLTMGGYDENGVEHIGIEQLYTKQLQAEQKRREGFTQSVVENFGDELKKKGKVTAGDMARVFGNDKTVLTDYSTPLFEKTGEGKDAEYTATKPVMDKMLSKDESVARTATALFQLAVLQDKAKFSNGDEMFSYNLNERMALYVLMKQPYTMKSLWHGNNLSASQLFQVFSSFVDAEEGSKMSRAKRFADYIQKDAAGSFDRINPISIERDNKDLKESRVMDYFGLVFENSPMYDEMKLSFQDEGHRTSDYSLSDGFLQNRDGTARALSLDLLSNWERQMQKQEHFIAFAGFMDNMSRVMLDNGMFNDIRRNNGEVAADWFSGFMKSVADGATKVNTTTDTVSKSFGWMRSNLAKAALAFNITPVLTQPATLAYAIAEGIPVSYMLSSMKSNVFDYDATTRMIYELSPQMKEQSRLDVDIAKATSKLELDTRKGRIQHYIDSVAQAGMKPMELLDRMVKNTLWLAKYNDVYDQLMADKQKGYSEEYSRRRAAMEADVFVLDTQTNNLAKNNPTAYKTNSDLLRSLQMFTSQSNKQFWYFRNGMTDAQKGQRAKAIAVNLFALSMTLALTCVARGKLIPKKDEDFDEWLARAAKDLGAEAFSMVPFIGNAVSQFGTGWSASGDLPIADVASDALSLLNTATEKEKKGSRKTKWEKIQTDMKNLALDSAGFIGLPEQAVKKLYNAVSDENLFKALGYDWGELGDSYL